MTEEQIAERLADYDRKRDLMARHEAEFLPRAMIEQPRPIGSALAAMLERLNSGTWPEGRPCVICGCETVDASEDPLCLKESCLQRSRSKRWAEKPKREMLAGCRVEDLYLEDFDVAKIRGPWRGEWPLCHFGRARSEAWAGEPPEVTIVGENQYGKSRMAAELMYRCIRARGGAISSALWIYALELHEEDRTEPLGRPRPLLHRAKTAGVLVVDDLGWSRDGIEILANLCEVRRARKAPTIWTSHLLFAHQTGRRSIQGLAPMIFARLKQGALFGLGKRLSR